MKNNNTFIAQIKKIVYLQKMFRHYLKIKKGKQNLKKFLIITIHNLLILVRIK